MEATVVSQARFDAILAAKNATIEEQAATIVEQAARIAILTAELERSNHTIAKLNEQLRRNSKNSHLPPSSDGPGTRNGDAREGTTGKGNGGKGNKGKGNKGNDTEKRKQGGQPKHRGHHRPVVPPEQVSHVVDVYPCSCDCCGADLEETEDPHPVRCQVIEIPEIKPDVTEFRYHGVRCSCGHMTRMDSRQVAKNVFGPRLMSIVALLTGVFHLSRRQCTRALRDILGTQISLGAVSSIENRVSTAVKPAVAEAWNEAQNAEVKHADATSWLERGAKRTLWVLATAGVTVFKIVTAGTAALARPLFGDCVGVLVSDRATVFSFWRMKHRQICWAHLVRRFIAFSERDGPAAEIGEELLGYAELLFEYWHELKAGNLSKDTYRAWMAPIRENFENCLQRAVDAEIDGVSGACADILAHREALWTFVDHPRVPPTNNHGEQELRAFVLWRRRCFGARSARGHFFAERIMTVAHTARKQNRDVLSFLYEACCAHVYGQPCPSLLRVDHAAS